MELSVLFGDGCLGSFDLGSNLLLRGSNLREIGVELGDGTGDFRFSGSEGFEFGDSGGDLDLPLAGHHLKRELKSVDFLDPMVKLGRPHVEFGRDVRVHVDLGRNVSGETSNEEFPRFSRLSKSESSGLGLLTELSGEHSVDLFDFVTFNLNRVGDESVEVVEINL